MKRGIGAQPKSPTWQVNEKRKRQLRLFELKICCLKFFICYDSDSARSFGSPGARADVPRAQNVASSGLRLLLLLPGCGSRSRRHSLVRFGEKKWLSSLNFMGGPRLCLRFLVSNSSSMQKMVCVTAVHVVGSAYSGIKNRNYCTTTFHARALQSFSALILLFLRFGSRYIPFLGIKHVLLLE
jgi:hypothetical protein